MKRPLQAKTASGTGLLAIISFYTKAFEYADKYAPEDMKLFYNDYGMASASKQQNVINLLREAKEAGWVDGIVCESFECYGQHG